MQTYFIHGAGRGAPRIGFQPHQPTLQREDQLALELGFPPSQALRWRRRRIEQLREGIESGSYHVDPARVAASLISRLEAAK